ncbi:hypothetical protein BGZ95_006656 [Linnemannia exigua]|uniref:Uncharacterized protein n=1 Tax=Linnemannia exigua TaxID=604196 RepID=A0AAD4H0Q5_9FUNG|nr:hypothetical protein BGZ95_006656 [Linnemannia exigua]
MTTIQTITPPTTPTRTDSDHQVKSQQSPPAVPKKKRLVLREQSSLRMSTPTTKKRMPLQEISLVDLENRVAGGGAKPGALLSFQAPNSNVQSQSRSHHRHVSPAVSSSRRLL